MKGNRRFRSMRVDLSIIIGLMIIMLVAAVSFLAYQFAFRALENNYLKQLDSTGKSIDNTITEFYNQQIRNARILSKDVRIIDALKTGETSQAKNAISDFHGESTHSLNIIAGSMEGEWPILFDVIGAATGLMLRDIVPELVEQLIQSDENKVIPKLSDSNNLA